MYLMANQEWASMAYLKLFVGQHERVPQLVIGPHGIKRNLGKFSVIVRRRKLSGDKPIKKLPGIQETIEVASLLSQ
jgi:hypothetical protein